MPLSTHPADAVNNYVPLEELDQESALKHLGDCRSPDDESRSIRSSINSFPALLYPLWDDINQVAGLPLVSDRQSAVISHGTALISTLSELEDLRESRDRMGTSLTGLERSARYHDTTYELSEFQLYLAVSKSQVSVTLSVSTGEEIRELQNSLRLSASQITRMAIIASVSTSVEWVPEDVQKVCEREFANFRVWIVRRT